MEFREEAEYIIGEAIQKVLPGEVVKQVLMQKDFSNRNIYVVAIGKAAWQMANATHEILGEKITNGIIVTKYGHSNGEIPAMQCLEAGHPIPDENTYIATQKVIDMVSNLTDKDTVLFLISGGGSSLFEKTYIPKTKMQNISKQLLECGANISEINTIRKHLSMVKGGRFAEICKPANIVSIVLSDVLGDPLDVIASGPAYPDSTTCDDAKKIIKKYKIQLSEDARECLNKETPKKLEHVETYIAGNVSCLCEAVRISCEKLGYEACVMTDCLDCEAKEAGAFMGTIAKTNRGTNVNRAFIFGGETVVCVHGKGKGGRNQEIALSAAQKISGLDNIAIFSFGSDGTDGPTDATGGFCDGKTEQRLKEQGIDIYEVLQNNDAYTALQSCGGLLITGPTGTNVNDASVILIKKQ